MLLTIQIISTSKLLISILYNFTRLPFCNFIFTRHYTLYFITLPGFHWLRDVVVRGNASVSRTHVLSGEPSTKTIFKLKICFTTFIIAFLNIRTIEDARMGLLDARRHHISISDSSATGISGYNCNLINTNRNQQIQTKKPTNMNKSNTSIN